MANPFGPTAHFKCNGHHPKSRSKLSCITTLRAARSHLPLQENEKTIEFSLERTQKGTGTKEEAKLWGSVCFFVPSIDRGCELVVLVYLRNDGLFSLS